MHIYLLCPTAQVLTNPHMLLVTLLLCNSAAMEVRQGQGRGQGQGRHAGITCNCTAALPAVLIPCRVMGCTSCMTGTSRPCEQQLAVALSAHPLDLVPEPHKIHQSWT